VLVDIVLPTGAMGNIAGGYMAKCMGVPLGKLNAGVNINDVSNTVIQTGHFFRSDAMHKTLSEAINIQLVRRRRK
jgi:threonine synthase